MLQDLTHGTFFIWLPVVSTRVTKMTGLGMETIFAKIKEEYARTDDVGKRKIQGHIRELQVGFYSDWDVVMRLSSGVGLLCLKS